MDSLFPFPLFGSEATRFPDDGMIVVMCYTTTSRSKTDFVNSLYVKFVTGRGSEIKAVTAFLPFCSCYLLVLYPIAKGNVDSRGTYYVGVNIFTAVIFASLTCTTIHPSGNFTVEQLYYFQRVSSTSYL